MPWSCLANISLSRLHAISLGSHEHIKHGPSDSWLVHPWYAGYCALPHVYVRSFCRYLGALTNILVADKCQTADIIYYQRQGSAESKAQNSTFELLVSDFDCIGYSISININDAKAPDLWMWMTCLGQKHSNIVNIKN